MRIRTKTPSNATPGFAIKLERDTDLGLATLIAEDGDGNYQPVGIASTIREAWEIASSDMRERQRRLERNEDPGIAPFRYRLWAVGIDGVYCVATVIGPEEAK